MEMVDIDAATVSCCESCPAAMLSHVVVFVSCTLIAMHCLPWMAYVFYQGFEYNNTTAASTLLDTRVLAYNQTPWDFVAVAVVGSFDIDTQT